MALTRVVRWQHFDNRFQQLLIWCCLWLAELTLVQLIKTESLITRVCRCAYENEILENNLVTFKLSWKQIWLFVIYFFNENKNEKHFCLSLANLNFEFCIKRWTHTTLSISEFNVKSLNLVTLKMKQIIVLLFLNLLVLALAEKESLTKNDGKKGNLPTDQTEEETPLKPQQRFGFGKL